MKFSVYLCLTATLAFAACAKSHDEVGGETNWLQTCDEDQSCARGSCLLGVCTIGCQHDSQCKGAFPGSCVQVPAIVSASGWKAAPPAADALCMPSCRDDESCGAGFVCRDSFCVAHPSPQDPDASQEGTPEATAFERCSDNVGCAEGQCLCGVCTSACQVDAQCTGTFSGRCTVTTTVVGWAGCEGEVPQVDGLCMPTCDDGHACEPGYQCIEHVCIKRLDGGVLNVP